ncbi:4-hydroxy-3-methylbut-2-en-1-yl diphosphate synthase [Prosthecochloris sp. GSB1]|uniref:(E)-4-hydroxy-3-methylbut-2-enyl-diphosphate synthase n=1 Tax=Prosthecochloris sp. GSB1 TaxID=281093 RepID=UPI000B8C9AD2|nr:(E)-4-hydroxy-3-methylbut-2-enyl-diphosphate synthase [Prosthecochloris sp. GSB1]ASQ89758.1 4-hydroxy-3-methylbut-2-en-1-yl diphosphate synthase [Prosthecochloris sp. GSB1]
MYAYRRRPTVEVGFGEISLGGYQPIRVESMTTTHTMDTRATVEQCRRLHDAGCEIIRMTVPTEKDAENLGAIRDQLRRDGIRTPLVADIHFSRRAAMKAVEYVDNVRINPGNYANRKKFSNDEYTDEAFRAEFGKVREEFLPLIAKAREFGVSMRIGTNHGSLSDRMVSRYGNTPDGMVEAALEFARICEDEGFHDILFSMKSSNVRVMIQAYRLLVTRADKELRHAYPLHLGVTEAGDGDEGRIKSAMGIGALLEEGLGDTIRVSLTEDPVNEVPVGFALVKKYNDFHKVKGEKGHVAVNQVIESRFARPSFDLPPFDPVGYSRRAADALVCDGLEIGGDAPPVVETSIGVFPDDQDELIAELRERLAIDRPDEAIRSELVSVPVVSSDEADRLAAALESFGGVASGRVGVATSDLSLFPALLDSFSKVRLDIVEGEPIGAEVFDAVHDADALVEFCFLHRKASVKVPGDVLARIACRMKARGVARALFSVDSREAVYACRHLVRRFREDGIGYPLVIRHRSGGKDRLNTLIDCSVQAGTLFCDGIGDAIALETGLDFREEEALAFNVLQASRVRMSKTEFISCPGCGRTYFDLEKTAGIIKSRMSHLKGLKIGIMGCVVNGPGEMADADFGYVGSGRGRASLYVGKECVEPNIPEERAVDRLVELIKSRGRWVEPAGTVVERRR